MQQPVQRPPLIRAHKLQFCGVYRRLPVPRWGLAGLSTAGKGGGNEDGGVGRGRKLKEILQNDVLFTVGSVAQNEEPFKRILVLRLALF